MRAARRIVPTVIRICTPAVSPSGTPDSFRAPKKDPRGSELLRGADAGAANPRGASACGAWLRARVAHRVHAAALVVQAHPRWIGHDDFAVLDRVPLIELHQVLAAGTSPQVTRVRTIAATLDSLLPDAATAGGPITKLVIDASVPPALRAYALRPSGVLRLVADSVLIELSLSLRGVQQRTGLAKVPMS